MNKIHPIIRKGLKVYHYSKNNIPLVVIDINHENGMLTTRYYNEVTGKFDIVCINSFEVNFEMSEV